MAIKDSLSRLKHIAALLSYSLLLVGHAKSELIPAARLVDWSAGVTVGVPGGTPSRTKLIDVTAAPYNADNTGAANASLAIQSAVNAASAGDVIYLPAGRYRMDTAITIGANRDDISVRGAGIDKTVIDARTATVFYVGTGSDYNWSWPASGNTITSGLNKGSKSISIADTSAFSVGQIVAVAFENQTSSEAIRNGATPTVSVSGFARLRRQLVRVTGKSTTSLAITPALAFTPDAGIAARVNVAQLQTDGVGIEDMTIDGSNASMTFPVHFEQCYGSWIQRVKVIKTQNYGVYLTNSLNCEVRTCIISERKTSGSNGAGILAGTIASCLIEDNIILGIFPAIEVNFSSMGNVFAYNVMENATGGTLNTNHGPHNSFNLYEGNVTPNIQSDGYFGSASDDTVFRNWIHGTNVSRTLRTFMVSLNRFTRNYSFVGNIFGETGTTGSSPYSFGNPNMGNSSFKGLASPSTGSFWRDWGANGSITSRTSDNSGQVTLASGSATPGQLVTLRWGSNSAHTISAVQSVSGNTFSWSAGSGSNLPALGSTVAVFFGPAGYQESDQDVERTSWRKANYFFGTKSIPASESIDGETLPPSLFRNSKPEWFGSMAWPPFDPFNPSPRFESIPAGYRYINGLTSSPPPAVAGSGPSNVRISVQH